MGHKLSKTQSPKKSHDNSTSSTSTSPPPPPSFHSSPPSIIITIRYIKKMEQQQNATTTLPAAIDCSEGHTRAATAMIASSAHPIAGQLVCNNTPQCHDNQSTEIIQNINNLNNNHNASTLTTTTQSMSIADNISPMNNSSLGNNKAHTTVTITTNDKNVLNAANNNNHTTICNPLIRATTGYESCVLDNSNVVAASSNTARNQTSQSLSSTINASSNICAHSSSSSSSSSSSNNNCISTRRIHENSNLSQTLTTASSTAPSASAYLVATTPTTAAIKFPDSESAHAAVKGTPLMHSSGKYYHPTSVCNNNLVLCSMNPQNHHSTVPVVDNSRLTPAADYQMEDCDERARIQRAIDINEGVDPPPGYSPQNPPHAVAHIHDAAVTQMERSFEVSQSNDKGFRICKDNNDEIVLRTHSQAEFIHCLVPDLQKITSCCFYWGKMDRYEAERLLDGKAEGTFLLRDSAQEDFLFSVSFRKYGRSLHARIEHFQHKFSFDCHDPDVFTSPTVTGLVEHYKDPSGVMFFEPTLTLPLNRNFSFSLQQLCRATIVSSTTYDGINELCLPASLKSYLKEYHYKHKVKVRSLDDAHCNVGHS